MEPFPLLKKVDINTSKHAHILIVPIYSKGIHVKTGDAFAIKIISKKKLAPEDLSSLMVEIQILDSISHPHIIKVRIH